MNKHKSIRRLWAMALCVLMLVGLLPVTASASDVSVPYIDVSGTRIFANGTPVVVREAGDKTNLYLAEDFSFTTPVFEDVSEYFIYGGWEDGEHIGNTSLTILSGTLNKAVYGGSRSGSLTGDTSVHISGGTVSATVFGGCAGANMTGNTGVTLSGGTIDWMYGGSNTGAITGNTSAVILSGTLDGGFYGGSYGGRITGNTSVLLKDGSVGAYVCGGGYDTPAVVDGDTFVRIEGGNISPNIPIRGGGYYAPVTGTTNVVVTGGTFDTNVIYGGGGENGPLKEALATVGNVNIEIGGNSTIQAIHGGGANAGVSGDVTITLKDNCKVTFWVCGGGATDQFTTADSAAVGGKVTITVQDDALVEGIIRGGGWSSSKVGSVDIYLRGGNVINKNAWMPTICGSGGSGDQVLGAAVIRQYPEAVVRNDYGFETIIALAFEGTVGDSSKIITYTEADLVLVYHANDGSGTTSKDYQKQDEPLDASLTAAVNPYTAPEGKRFKEWNTEETGGGASYAPGAPIDTSDTGALLNLYAIWENKFLPSGTPSYTAITGEGKTLADATLGIGSISPVGTVQWSLNDSTSVKADVQYEWKFTPSDSDNYSAMTGVIVLWRSPAPLPVTDGGGGAIAPTIPAADGAAQVNYTALNGTAALQLPAAKVSEIIEKSTGGAAVLNLSGVSGASAAEFPKTALSAFEDAGLDLTLKLPAGTITLDETAAASVARQATGSTLRVELKQTAANTLNAEQQEAVKSGDVVLDINIYSDTKKISSFDGALTVQLPYTGPLPVAVWYLNDAGELKNLESIFQNGILSFVLGHLSLYVVGQDTAWENPFADVKEADWYYDAVSFIAQKGITTGTTAMTFSPNGTLTRGQFITLLLRAYEIKPDENQTDNFSDAGNTYYTAYLAAAKRLGISNGVGDNQFTPEAAITRQEMFTLLYNALKSIDKLPTADSGKTLADFSDSGEIASWAQEAMTALVKSGTVAGSGGRLNPASGSTRAQMAQVLYNLLGK